MAKPTLLWVNLTRITGTAQPLLAANEDFDIYQVTDIEDIDPRIHTRKPAALCFDYDHPDTHGLAALERTKRDHPTLPILMLTEYHSEALAVWAFRSRVWDFLVKPIPEQALLRSVAELLTIGNRQTRSAPREFIARTFATRHEDPISTPIGNHRAIIKAKMYISMNLDKRITGAAVAALCGMSQSCFSRTFHKSCGMTFSEYLLRARTQQAAKLLRNPQYSVSQVCFSVGFQDQSYFSRIFRRYMGKTPSGYRDAADIEDPINN